MHQWEKIYKREGLNYKYYNILKPHEDIHLVAKIFRKHKVKKILDLGCGAGRQLLFLAKKGFDVDGIDISKSGIDILRTHLKRQKLKAQLRVGDVFKKLPYSNNFFDAVISIQVLQHSRLKGIMKSTKEINRVLKPGGLVFITLCGRTSKGKVRYCLVKTAKKIGKRIFVPTMGNEKGLVHYIYSKQTLKRHYKDFKILKLWKDSKHYYCFIARKKRQIKALILDYGGVIGNNPDKFIFKLVSKKFGLKTSRIKSELHKYVIKLEKGQISQKIFWKKFAKDLGVRDHNALRKIWVTTYKKHAKIDKRMLFLLKLLKEDYKLCLLSNKAMFYKKDCISKVLKQVFKVIIYSHNVKMRKPEKKIYKYTLKRLNVKPKQCLIVDDQQRGLVCPKKMGMKTIHFKSFSQFKKELLLEFYSLF